MKNQESRVFATYIVTNPNKTTLYIGVTNNLPARLFEHWENRGKTDTFAGKYYCHNLIYFELFDDIRVAINREKELKKWRREKKEALINISNPEWKFLNAEAARIWTSGNINRYKKFTA